jgi:acyl-CoA-binding protein
MAMDPKGQFEQAIEKAKSLPSQSNEVLLELYGLFKQATQGDVDGERPGGFDFRGAAKYDAWNARKGMSTEEAMQAYADLVKRLASD